MCVLRTSDWQPITNIVPRSSKMPFRSIVIYIRMNKIAEERFLSLHLSTEESLICCDFLPWTCENIAESSWKCKSLCNTGFIAGPVQISMPLNQNTATNLPPKPGVCIYVCVSQVIKTTVVASVMCFCLYVYCVLGGGNFKQKHNPGTLKSFCF